MFFPERITKISKGDRVLEVGPGGSPHPRSDVLLEKVFANDEEKAAQRGYAPDLPPGKTVVTYEGDTFPFPDQAFDYVICSHVLEHVDDVTRFVAELNRVARRGYLEYPTVYYDYLYNFRVHQNFVHYRDGVLRWMTKADSQLALFEPVQRLFYESLVAGHEEIIGALKRQMFEGLEWEGTLAVRRTRELSEICIPPELFRFSSPPPPQPPQPPSTGLRQRLAAAVRRWL